MKKIYSAKNPMEAHLLVGSLCREGIRASVHDDTMLAAAEGSSVWIENAFDEERALELIAEMTGPPPADPAPSPAAPARPRGLPRGFLLGLIVGAALSYFAARGWNKSEPSPPTEWDSNADGLVDYWDEYSPEGLIVTNMQDRNFDGKADIWFRYDPPGNLVVVEYDEDFDGRLDAWEFFEKGAAHSFQADNDRDGVVDAWGKIEGGIVVERNWSFAGDGVVDKRAFYSKGRKTREQVDLDRDGVFDETIAFDEFERPLPQ